MPRGATLAGVLLLAALSGGCAGDGVDTTKVGEDTLLIESGGSLLSGASMVREAAYLEAARATLAQGGDRFVIVGVEGASRKQFVYGLGPVHAPGFDITVKVLRKGEDASTYRRVYVADEVIAKYGRKP